MQEFAECLPIHAATAEYEGKAPDLGLASFPPDLSKKTPALQHPAS